VNRAPQSLSFRVHVNEYLVPLLSLCSAHKLVDGESIEKLVSQEKGKAERNVTQRTVDNELLHSSKDYLI
jgi:hypothetical protein